MAPHLQVLSSSLTEKHGGEELLVWLCVQLYCSCLELCSRKSTAAVACPSSLWWYVPAVLCQSVRASTKTQAATVPMKMRMSLMLMHLIAPIRATMTHSAAECCNRTLEQRLRLVKF